MSMSKLISQVASAINEARNAYFAHDPDGVGYWKNGGISQAICKATVQTILDTAARNLATEKQLNLSMFGKFSVLDEACPENGKGIHISFRPSPRLARLIKETPTGKTPGLMKEVSELSSYSSTDLSTNIVTTMTQKFAKNISDEMQRMICDLLVSTGDTTIQQLGTFLVTNDEGSSKRLSSKVRFSPKPYLKDLLSTLTDQQVNEMVAAREDKRARRKKASVSSGTLDRKRLARVRKLLRSTDPENVAMAMLVLEQIALPDDYRAVFETSGLVERLLRVDSADMVDSVAKIVAGTENESIQDQFWTLIGLKEKHSAAELQIRGKLISSTALAEFLGETRNQLITSFQCHYCSNLSEIRLAGLGQLIEVKMSESGVTTLELANLPALKNTAITSSGLLCELSLSGLDNLEKLKLSESGVTTLELENLPALKNASITSCGQLCELSLAGLDNLETLNLHSCSIRSIPEEFGTLRSLRESTLSHNPLEALPDSIGQLSQLKTLYLTGTSLKTLPDSIGQLSQLKTLYLDGTSLETLPDSIGQLSQLEILNLSGSSLVELPASIGGLAALTKLDLSSTNIENLPGTIGQLESLTKLVLPSEIKEVPRELGQLSSLRELYFGSRHSSEESTTTRIILDLCRQLVGATDR